MSLLMGGGWAEKMGPDTGDLGRNWLGESRWSLVFGIELIDGRVCHKNVPFCGLLAGANYGLLFRVYVFVFLPCHIRVFHSVPKYSRVPPLLIPNLQKTN